MCQDPYTLYIHPTPCTQSPATHTLNPLARTHTHTHTFSSFMARSDNVLSSGEEPLIVFVVAPFAQATRKYLPPPLSPTIHTHAFEALIIFLFLRLALLLLLLLFLVFFLLLPRYLWLLHCGAFSPGAHFGILMGINGIVRRALTICQATVQYSSSASGLQHTLKLLKPTTKALIRCA